MAAEGGNAPMPPCLVTVDKSLSCEKDNVTTVADQFFALSSFISFPTFHAAPSLLRHPAKALDLWNNYPEKWSSLSKLECSEDMARVWLVLTCVDHAMSALYHSMAFKMFSDDFGSTLLLNLAGEFGKDCQQRISAAHQPIYKNTKTYLDETQSVRLGSNHSNLSGWEL